MTPSPHEASDPTASGPSAPGGEPGAAVELTIVTLRFEAADAAKLAGVLANYVVTTRGEPGCRNVDFCESVTQPGRFVIIEKWDSPTAQRVHFDAPSMVLMARSCDGLLATAPEIDLLEGISAHDLH